MEEKELSKLVADSIEEEIGRVRYLQEFGYAVRTTIYALITVVAFALLFATLFFPVLQVYGTCMEPAVEEDTFVLAVKTGTPDREDVLAFYYNNKILIRRVIGLPGDKIEISKNGVVIVNGETLQESYVSSLSLGNCNIEFPYEVPKGQYFVMADVRADSVDSRNAIMGCVSEEDFVGVCRLKIWPLNKIGLVH